MKDATRSQTFTDDLLNRLATAQEGSRWSNVYTYDAWGNLSKKLYGPIAAGEHLDTSADTGNHLIGYSYDAGGNMTSDGVNTYAYDGENRISSVAGVSYTYDADGRRVKKSSGTNYWYGPSGEALAETDSAGTWTNYVFFAGQRLARNVNGDIKYYVTDHLHSTAMFADKSGTVLDDNDFYPWGGVVLGVGQTTSNNTIKFTGKYRDTESGLDYFGARYYANVMGRFMSPDWAAKPVTVPYAKFGDPQSLNLYGYVENGPVNRIDADGHSYAGFDGFMRPKGGGFTDIDNEIDFEVNTEAANDAAMDAANAADAASRGSSPQQQQNATKGPMMGIGIEEPAASAVQNNVLNVASDPGHAFIYLKDASGNIVSMLSFGPGEPIGVMNKGQFTSGKLGGNAHWPLGGAANTWTITITQGQLAAGKAAISAFKGNVPNYTPAMQCTSAALSIAAKMGVRLPSGVGRVVARAYGHTFYSGRVANPYHLNQQMTGRFGPPTVVNTSIFPAP